LTPPPYAIDGAVGLGAIDEALHPLDVLEMDVRADLGVLVARVALPDLRSALAEALGERLGDPALHEQARAREADLTGVVVLLDREIDGQIVLGSRPRDSLRGGHRAGEADARDIGILSERRSGLDAEALHDVEHTGRQARLVRQRRRSTTR